MYERSVSILERYFEKMFSFSKKSLNEIYQNYIKTVEEIEKYQEISQKEEDIIKEFEKVANEIQDIQKKQEKLTKANIDLEENAETIETQFTKIENKIIENNNELEILRQSFIEYLKEFTEKQKERNKCSRARRLIENEYLEYMKIANDEINSTDINEINKIKKFIVSDSEIIEKELIKILTENGKNEKVGFNQEVIKNAVNLRTEIAKKEAECYILSFERTRKILEEVDKDSFKIAKYKKALRDISAKLEFLNAEKEYIAGFLDNERMTAINGEKIHKKMMQEACKNFETDKEQISNLYELILRETSSKATKKAYKELYDKTYLQNIQENEKVFEEEINNIDIKLGTVINSNYWRIEGIKHIYETFKNVVSEKFEKDLEELGIEENKASFEDLDMENTIETENRTSVNEEFNNIKLQNRVSLNEDIDQYLDDEEDEEQEDSSKFYYAEEKENHLEEDTYSKKYENYDDYDEEEYEDETEYDEENYEEDDIEEAEYDDEEDYDEYDEYDEDEYEDEEDYDEDEYSKEDDDDDGIEDEEDYYDDEEYDEDEYDEEDYNDEEDSDEGDYETELFNDEDEYDEEEDYDDEEDEEINEKFKQNQIKKHKTNKKNESRNTKKSDKYLNKEKFRNNKDNIKENEIYKSDYKKGRENRNSANNMQKSSKKDYYDIYKFDINKSVKNNKVAVRNRDNVKKKKEEESQVKSIFKRLFKEKNN